MFEGISHETTFRTTSDNVGWEIHFIRRETINYTSLWYDRDNYALTLQTPYGFCTLNLPRFLIVKRHSHPWYQKFIHTLWNRAFPQSFQHKL